MLKEKSLKEGKRAVAKQMLTKGMDKTLISKATGFFLDEIKERQNVLSFNPFI